MLRPPPAPSAARTLSVRIEGAPLVLVIVAALPALKRLSERRVWLKPARSKVEMPAVDISRMALVGRPSLAPRKTSACWLMK